VYYRTIDVRNINRKSIDYIGTGNAQNGISINNISIENNKNRRYNINE
jgi:hypothetical protein